MGYIGTHAINHFNMDFYLYDGKYYLSVRSLAQLIGISPGSLLDQRHGLLLRIKNNQDLPPSLQQWAGFDHTESGKIPQDLACSLLIYYAYEAGPACKDQAKFALFKLAELGLETFVSRA